MLPLIELEMRMPQYRLFLLDKDDHIVRSMEQECVERDIALVARDMIQSEVPSVHGIEVWEGTRRLDRIRRV